MVQWFSILVSKTNDEGSNPSKPALTCYTKNTFDFKKPKKSLVLKNGESPLF